MSTASETETAATAVSGRERLAFSERLHRATPRIWVTAAIVAANALVFTAMLAAGAGLLAPNPEVYLDWGANFGPATKDGEWWRLLASLFLHFGIVHLLFNMWALWDAGRIVERLYGNAVFLMLYLFAGTAGSLASLLWNADRVVSAGASGAVFGVYGALFAYMTAQRGSVPPAVLKGLAASAAAFVAYALLFGLVQPGIDNAAHVGGLASGFAAGLALASPLVPGARLAHWRGIAAAVGGLAVLGALWAVLPVASYSYKAQRSAEVALGAFLGEESEVVRAARGVLEPLQRGEITPALAGARLEKEVVPRWDAAHRRLAAIELGAGAPAAERLRLFMRFAVVRRDMLSALGAGLREDDDAKIRRADELAAESQMLLEQIRRLYRKPL